MRGKTDLLSRDSLPRQIQNKYKTNENRKAPCEERKQYAIRHLVKAAVTFRGLEKIIGNKVGQSPINLYSTEPKYYHLIPVITLGISTSLIT